jgi:hypothetical protein
VLALLNLLCVIERVTSVAELVYRALEFWCSDLGFCQLRARITVVLLGVAAPIFGLVAHALPPPLSVPVVRHAEASGMPPSACPSSHFAVREREDGDADRGQWAYRRPFDKPANG